MKKKFMHLLADFGGNMRRSEEQSGFNEEPDFKLIRRIEFYESSKELLRPILRKKLKIKIIKQRLNELIAKLERIQKDKNSTEELTEADKKLIQMFLPL